MVDILNIAGEPIFDDRQVRALHIQSVHQHVLTQRQNKSTHTVNVSPEDGANMSSHPQKYMRQTTIYHSMKLPREGRWKNPAALTWRSCKGEQFRRDILESPSRDAYGESRGSLLICVSSRRTL